MTQNSISQNALKSAVGSSGEGLRLIVFLGFRDSEAVALKRNLDIPTVAPSRHKISEAGIRHTNRQPETRHSLGSSSFKASLPFCLSCLRAPLFMIFWQPRLLMSSGFWLAEIPHLKPETRNQSWQQEKKGFRG